MKNETVKEKFVNFVSKMGKKNLVVIASVTVIAVALIVGITVFNQQKDDGFDYSQGTGMQDVNSESDKQKESDNSRTLLTIVNYSVFQDCEYTNEHSNGNSDDTPTNTPSEHKQEYKECKEDNNNIYSRVEADLGEKRKTIVAYLNTVCKTAYRHNSKNTVKHINARLKEGYTEEDFKSVIDKKAKEWLGTNMEQYLRPETLFGTKFEGYLNQKTTTEKEEDYESESSIRLW